MILQVSPVLYDRGHVATNYVENRHWMCCPASFVMPISQLRKMCNISVFLQVKSFSHTPLSWLGTTSPVNTFWMLTPRNLWNVWFESGRQKASEMSITRGICEGLECSTTILWRPYIGARGALRRLNLVPRMRLMDWWVLSLKEICIHL